MVTSIGPSASGSGSLMVSVSVGAVLSVWTLGRLRLMEQASEAAGSAALTRSKGGFIGSSSCLEISEHNTPAPPEGCRPPLTGLAIPSTLYLNNLTLVRFISDAQAFQRPPAQRPDSRRRRTAVPRERLPRHLGARHRQGGRRARGEPVPPHRR